MRHFGHKRAAALLGRLDGMGLKPVLAETWPYPKALQLAAGRHQLCGCRGSPQWPQCSGELADCARLCTTLELAKPRFFWLCQCGTSKQLPYCDGEGHLQSPGTSVDLAQP